MRHFMILTIATASIFGFSCKKDVDPNWAAEALKEEKKTVVSPSQEGEMIPIGLEVYTLMSRRKSNPHYVDDFRDAFQRDAECVVWHAQNRIPVSEALAQDIKKRGVYTVQKNLSIRDIKQRQRAQLCFLAADAGGMSHPWHKWVPRGLALIPELNCGDLSLLRDSRNK